MGQPRPLFVYFRFSNTNFEEKSVDVSRIRTQIIRVEGEHADHLTTTVGTHIRNDVFKAPLPPKWLLLGSPMLTDPHPSQQHAGLHHTVWQLQEEVTRPSLNLPRQRSLGWMGEKWCCIANFVWSCSPEWGLVNSRERIVRTCHLGTGL